MSFLKLVISNPSKGKTRFQVQNWKQGQFSSILILDAMGRTLEKVNLDENGSAERDFNFPSGCYFIRLETENGMSVVQKMLIEK